MVPAVLEFVATLAHYTKSQGQNDATESPKTIFFEIRATVSHQNQAYSKGVRLRRITQEYYRNDVTSSH